MYRSFVWWVRISTICARSTAHNFAAATPSSQQQNLSPTALIYIYINALCRTCGAAVQASANPVVVRSAERPEPIFFCVAWGRRRCLARAFLIDPSVCCALDAVGRRPCVQARILPCRALASPPRARPASIAGLALGPYTSCPTLGFLGSVSCWPEVCCCLLGS